MSTKSNRNLSGCNSFAMVSNAQKIHKLMKWMGFHGIKLDNDVISDLFKAPENKASKLVHAIKLFAGRMVIVDIHKYHKMSRGQVLAFYAVRFTCGSTILINARNYKTSAMAMG